MGTAIYNINNIVPYFQPAMKIAKMFIVLFSQQYYKQAVEFYSNVCIVQLDLCGHFGTQSSLKTDFTVLANVLYILTTKLI